MSPAARAMRPFLLTVQMVVLSACSPEVGSEAWCKAMAATPKTGWTLKDAGAYAASCVVSLPGRVGSADWCKAMEAKSPGDWSANDARNYAMQCIAR